MLQMYIKSIFTPAIGIIVAKIIHPMSTKEIWIYSPLHYQKSSSFNSSSVRQSFRLHRIGAALVRGNSKPVLNHINGHSASHTLSLFWASSKYTPGNKRATKTIRVRGWPALRRLLPPAFDAPLLYKLMEWIACFQASNAGGGGNARWSWLPWNRASLHVETEAEQQRPLRTDQDSQYGFGVTARPATTTTTTTATIIQAPRGMYTKHRRLGWDDRTPLKLTAAPRVRPNLTLPGANLQIAQRWETDLFGAAWLITRTCFLEHLMLAPKSC